MAFRAAVLAVFWLYAASRCFAISIALDFSHDSFFDSHPLAKATLQKAAQDISDAITTHLAATSDTSTGGFGSTQITFDFEYSYTQPITNGGDLTFNPTILANDEVRVFVGMRRLTTNSLGEGGPGGFGYAVNEFNYFPSELPNAVQNAAAAANGNMRRGGGPIIGHLSDNFGEPGTTFTVNFGSSIGHLWFDKDTNNNGVDDNDSQLNNYWQFDYNASPAGKNDFYSVALHELLHVVGFGTSESWETRRVGAQGWNGPQVSALVGSGVNILSPDGAHVLEGFKSTRLDGGALQEAVMDPTITFGTRKTLTRLDLAFLRDIGWQTIDYPLLPGDFNFDNVLTAADVGEMLKAMTNLNGFAASHSLTDDELKTLANVNGDAKISNADIQALLNLLSAAGAGSAEIVPEPASVLLLICGGIALALCRGGRSIRRRSG